MANIQPFKAIRPTRDKASLVATRSYLSYNEETIKEKLNHNPYTFLHVINPDFNKNLRAKGKAKYNLIKEKLSSFIKSQILLKDDSCSYYIYQKIDKVNTFTGIIAAASINDYLNNKIKIHEQTISKKEKMFRDYLDITEFNAEPVLLTHTPNEKIKIILKKYINLRSEYEFTTTNKCLHKLWIVKDSKDILNITNSFKEIDNLYIADGHHRCASSALLSKYKQSKESNYFMSFLINENQLKILNFNRLIKHTNNLSVDDLIDRIKVSFKVTIKNKAFSPNLRDEIGMYINNKWYSLIAKENKYSTISSSLDPSILTDKILKPILNIKDERSDENLSFYNGNISLDDIKQKVDNNQYAVAFILKPIPFSSIRKVADNNEILPPKSTYVEPKIRSGLTIYSLV
jgi:uncharacterized protein (DUF1015 family)